MNDRSPEGLPLPNSPPAASPPHELPPNEPPGHTPRPIDAPPGREREGEPRAFLGAPPEAPRAQPVDEATAALGLTLRALTPRTWVTPTLVVLNLGTYVAMIAAGVHPLAPASEDILAWGGNYSDATTRGEWWRLLTCTFLHIGLLHLALNMWALWSVGRLVERLFGNLGFAALYLGAGLIGSIASLIFNPELLSAGASGAVFGVFGALMGVVVRLRGRLPPAFVKSLTRDSAFVLVANLAITFSVSGIDVAAHLGGLGAGMLFALVLAHPIDARAARGRVRRALVVIALAAASVAGGSFYAAQTSGKNQALLRDVSQGEQRALNRYNAANLKLQQGELPAPAMADVIEKEVLPVWREARRKLGLLADSGRRNARTYGEYMSVRDESWVLLAAALRDGDQAKAEQAMVKNKAAEQRLNTLLGPKKKP